MAAGIQIFNADGSLQFDGSNRLLLLLDSFDTGASAGSRTLDNPGIGTVVVNQIDGGTPGVSKPHDIDVSGNTVSWSGGNVSSKVRVMVF